MKICILYKYKRHILCLTPTRYETARKHIMYLGILMCIYAYWMPLRHLTGCITVNYLIYLENATYLFSIRRLIIRDRKFKPLGIAKPLTSLLPQMVWSKGGRILSPILFCVYIDELLLSINQSNLGCHIGHLSYAGLGYADDVTTSAPNLDGMQAIIHICEEFGKEYNVIWNWKNVQFCVPPSLL